MAHKILGIDLGSFSVKVAELDAGFRQTSLIGLYERPLLPPLEGESQLDRAARTLEELIATERLQPEMCAASMQGEAVLRILSLPFSDPKKIEQVLGYELESQILGDLDTLVFDGVVAGTHHTTNAGEVAASEMTNVIAVAAPRIDVRNLIDTLARVRAEPKIIGAAALSYAALRAVDLHDAAEPRVVIDIGNRHTHVCIILGGKVLFARSIARGGEDVTVAISEAFHTSMLDAERTKHQRASLTPGVHAEERLFNCVRDAVRPLMRELKQTIAAFRASDNVLLSKVLITGGGARLEGFATHLENELGMSVAGLELDPRDPFIRGDLRAFEGAMGPRLPAQALGLALAAAQPVPQANLRKGELAYRTDYSYLRGKARYMGLATVAILAFATINALASLRALRHEAEGLEGRLRRETMELFGEARLDGKAVSEELRSGGPKGGAPPIPNLSAYDVLDEISLHVPPPDKGKFDVLELEIKPKKTTIKATASSREYVEELEAGLKQIECFEDVQKGKVVTVTAPPSGENSSGEKADKVEEFTMNITTSCP